MRNRSQWLYRACAWALAAVALPGAGPARAQWTRVTALPPVETFTVAAFGDTLLAGTDSTVYVSVDAGASWTPSAAVAPGVGAVTALWFHDGRLLAGTYGQGVFASDDRGAHWADDSAGLTGGFLGTERFVVDLVPAGARLFAATAGAGVYARTLPAGDWEHFGDVFEPEQASNVNGLATDGSRVLAAAGGNGMVFVRDPGDPDWTPSFLDNLGIHAGLMAQCAVWTGPSWLVATQAGLFRSATGTSPWVRWDPGLGVLIGEALATGAGRTFVALDTPTGVGIAESTDGGATWVAPEYLPGVFVEKLALCRTTLYAARGDGLWSRPVGAASVAGGPPRRLGVTLLGAQPAAGPVRIRLELSAPGSARVALHDVLGREVAPSIERTWPAGASEATFDLRALPPGIYLADVRAGSEHRAVRIVHVR